MRTRSSNDPARRAPRPRRLFAAGIAAVILAPGLTSAVASPGAPAGQADPTPVAAVQAVQAPQAAKQAVGISYLGGPGHPGPVWAGTWDNGERGFCIDFTRHSPNNSGTTTITGAIPGMTAAQSARIKQIANTYARTTSPKQAARAQFAIWAVEADPDFTRWYRASAVSRADRKAVAAIVAASSRAPSEISMSAGKVQVGQEGTGKVVAVRGAAAAAAAAGLPVTVSATGAKIRSVNGVPGARGRMTTAGLTFTYERKGPGTVDFRAVLSVPSRVRGGLSVTSGEHQRTLGGAHFDAVAATFGYLLTPGQPTITASCDTDCNGVADLVVKACNAAGADPIRWTHMAGQKVVATLAVPGGKCASTKAKGADGSTIASSYCYTATAGGQCATARTTAPKRYEVVCPPWVRATYELACDCPGSGGSRVTFTAPAGVRFYRGLVTVTAAGKSTPRRVDLPNGAPTTVDLPALPRGGEVEISFLAFRDAARTRLLGGPHVLARLTVAAPA